MVIHLFEHGDVGHSRLVEFCHTDLVVDADKDQLVSDKVMMDNQQVWVEQLLLELLELMHLVLLIVLFLLVCQVCRAILKFLFLVISNKNQILKFTSFVLRFGVERDELEPERDGGRSLTLFNLLEPAFSPFRSPFNPMLSRSRDSE
jgi:hypothetical protein